MPLAEEIQALAARIPSLIEHLQTEEATKTALVMPFIEALGYDFRDPREIVPEFTADAGRRRGEKVDYAIMSEGKPIILFECKAANKNLNEENADQLFRYFTFTDARFGVLTNGVVYRFHSDLDDLHRMDPKPFLEFDITAADASVMEQLQRFTKGAFDLASILGAAGELKYTREIILRISQQLKSPSEEFVRFCAKGIFSGKMTPTNLERFSQITKDAFNQFINDSVYSRLRSAMTSGTTLPPSPPPIQQEVARPSDIQTTEEELQGLYIVKAIIRDVIDPSRVVMRDVQSYCGILLDDNNRQPICRLRFNTVQKYLGLMDEERNEERHPIASTDGIYAFGDQLQATVRRYIGE